jgi:hypothetical protein
MKMYYALVDKYGRIVSVVKTKVKKKHLVEKMVQRVSEEQVKRLLKDGIIIEEI